MDKTFKKEQFCDRLHKYRLELGINTQAEMAKKIGIARTYYSMLESGSREPSDNILHKLSELSDLPDEYWLYGSSSDKDYYSLRNEFKSVREVFYSLLEEKLLNIDDPIEGYEKIFYAALSIDLKHLIKKNTVD